MRILFDRHRAIGLRFVILLIMILAFLIVDHRTTYLNSVRSTINLALTPLLYAVDAPISLAQWTRTHLSAQRTLIKDKQQLQARLIKLQSRVQRYMALEKENAYLRALLSSAPKAGGRVLAAQLISVNPDPYIHQIVLDKGKEAHVYVGQSVMDANGVMGQVISVSPLSSHVLLLTDTQSAIPVEVVRNGVRAIVVGVSDSDRLSLLHVDNTADLAVGDELVTSGLGQHYPSGYPVGVVESIEHHLGDRFATVIVRPHAKIHRSRLVLLVWPNESNSVNVSKVKTSKVKTSSVAHKKPVTDSSKKLQEEPHV